jgi:hypothetical protein
MELVPLEDINKVSRSNLLALSEASLEVGSLDNLLEALGRLELHREEQGHQICARTSVPSSLPHLHTRSLVTCCMHAHMHKAWYTHMHMHKEWCTLTHLDLSMQTSPQRD